MNLPIEKITALFLAAAVFAGGAARAQYLDEIGVTQLRAVATNLDGSGIRVAQPEAALDSPSSFYIWEINPANVGQSAGRFTYYSAGGSANFYPNNLGTNSSHAEGVGGGFYGMPGGVATNVAHIDNYEADFFISNYVGNLAPMPAAAVVNQSFTFGPLAAGDQQDVDSAYDDYEETFGTLFVSAANNFDGSATVCAPGTSYNCISVGAYDSGNYYNSLGPTVDNGRCKPDITANSGATSFSTPQVSGAAALLMQAALRGDGGSDTNSACDIRAIKALLLNGAVKPLGWTNSNSSPLDARYGAGVLNVLNSYEQLAGGKHIFCATNFISLGAAHPPVAVTNTISSPRGWDLEMISSTATNDAAAHYFFNASNGLATATLTWNRQLGETNINDLDLFLVNAANSNLVACSTSRVDNVEHLRVTNLAAGRYDLQVVKNGGTNVVSDAEVFALAWEFISPALQITGSGTNALLTWPVYPAGFLVEARTNLISGAWSTNGFSTPVITNGLNSLPLNTTNAAQFFRLRKPNL